MKESILTWFTLRIEIQLDENLESKKKKNTEKITFKVVQMKFLAMHITNQKLVLDIFTEADLQKNLIEFVLIS